MCAMLISSSSVFSHRQRFADENFCSTNNRTTTVRDQSHWKPMEWNVSAARTHENTREADANREISCNTDRTRKARAASAKVPERMIPIHSNQLTVVDSRRRADGSRRKPTTSSQFSIFQKLDRARQNTFHF